MSPKSIRANCFGRVAAAAVYACLAIGPLTAQPPANFDQLLSARASAALQESGVPSVSIAVVDRNSLIYAKAFGKANLAAGRDAETSP